MIDELGEEKVDGLVLYSHTSVLSSFPVSVLPSSCKRRYLVLKATVAVTVVASDSTASTSIRYGVSKETQKQ